MTYKLALEDSSYQWTFKESIKLVWTDPPFGTNKKQSQGGNSFKDLSPSEATALTVSAIENLCPYLSHDSVVCICADYRIIHYVVSDLRDILYFQGEVIWTFGLGRPRTDWWPNRHNTIATFTKAKTLPAFDKTAIPREVRKAPKAGYTDDKPAGSVWDKTLSNTDPERVGYPNQKPLDIIDPFVMAHTKPGDWVADPFMGSGSTGHAALLNDCKFLGQDLNPEALEVVGRRLDGI